MKYKYKSICVPAEVANKAENTMQLVGCRTMTNFVTMALIEYIKRIEHEHAELLEAK